MWLFHIQGEGTPDRGDDLGFLSALARNWLGERHCQIDGHSAGKRAFANVEFIMLSELKPLLPRHVYTTTKMNHARTSVMAQNVI